MYPSGKILIAAGMIMIFLGLAISCKLGPLGKLPGDILFEKDNFKLYFPMTTGIVLSLIISVALWFFKR